MSNNRNRYNNPCSGRGGRVGHSSCDDQKEQKFDEKSFKRIQRIEQERMVVILKGE